MRTLAALAGRAVDQFGSIARLSDLMLFFALGGALFALTEIARAAGRVELAGAQRAPGHQRRRERGTRLRLPALLAALIVAKNPEKYGFVGIRYQEPQYYETVYVPAQKSLRDIAKVIGVSQTELIELNPALRLKATPPGAPYDINVPPGYGVIVAQKGSELSALGNVNTQIAKYRGSRSYRVSWSGGQPRLSGNYSGYFSRKDTLI